VRTPDNLLHKLENPTPSLHLTHFAVAADGTVVVSSAPNQGRPMAAGSIFVAQPNQPLVEAKLPPDVAARLHDETLSIAISDARKLAAVTVPEGNLVVYLRLSDGGFVGASPFDRPAGIGLSPDGAHFIVGTRRSMRWVRVDTLAEEPGRKSADGGGSLSHLLIASG